MGDFALVSVIVVIIDDYNTIIVLVFCLRPLRNFLRRQTHHCCVLVSWLGKSEQAAFRRIVRLLIPLSNAANTRNVYTWRRIIKIIMSSRKCFVCVFSTTRYAHTSAANGVRVAPVCLTGRWRQYTLPLAHILERVNKRTDLHLQNPAFFMNVWNPRLLFRDPVYAGGKGDFDDLL